MFVFFFVELAGFEPASKEFSQRYTTSLFRVLSFAYRPSTDGVAICYPVGLRPPSTGVGAVAPWSVSPGSRHPGLGGSDVATMQQRVRNCCCRLWLCP